MSTEKVPSCPYCRDPYPCPHDLAAEMRQRANPPATPHPEAEDGEAGLIRAVLGAFVAYNEKSAAECVALVRKRVAADLDEALRLLEGWVRVQSKRTGCLFDGEPECDCRQCQSRALLSRHGRGG